MPVDIELFLLADPSRAQVIGEFLGCLAVSALFVRW